MLGADPASRGHAPAVVPNALVPARHKLTAPRLSRLPFTFNWLAFPAKSVNEERMSRSVGRKEPVGVSWLNYCIGSRPS
jgi:hypothetical protein